MKIPKFNLPNAEHVHTIIESVLAHTEEWSVEYFSMGDRAKMRADAICMIKDKDLSDEMAKVYDFVWSDIVRLHPYNTDVIRKMRANCYYSAIEAILGLVVVKDAAEMFTSSHDVILVLAALGDTTAQYFAASAIAFERIREKNHLTLNTP